MSGTALAEAFIAVRPSFAGFQEEVRSEADRTRASVNVRVKADSAGLKRQIEEDTKGAGKEIKIPVKATTGAGGILGGIRKTANAEAESAGKEAGGRFSSGFKNMLGMGAGLVGLASIGAAFKTVVGGALTLQESTDRLKTSAHNMGLSWGVVSKGLSDATSAGANLGFTSQKIADVYGTLITRTGSVAKAHQELTVSENLARFKHEDLATATNTVSKAYMGNSKALKDLGIVLPAHATATQKAAAMQEYANRISGQASGYTHTLSGKMTVLKTEFENAATSLGTKLMPYLSR